jgi:hypothetical protein
MKYHIIHELPRRVRLGCGRFVFESERAAALEQFLLAQGGVETARVSCATGNVVLTFEEGRKEAVLDSLGALDLASLPEAAAAGSHEADEEFQNNIFRLISVRILTRCLLPTPLRLAHTYYKAALRVGKGVKALVWDGRLNVDVLDAAAVSAALAQGQSGTASSVMYMLSLGEPCQGHELPHGGLFLRHKTFHAHSGVVRHAGVRPEADFCQGRQISRSYRRSGYDYFR